MPGNVAPKGPLNARYADKSAYQRINQMPELSLRAYLHREVVCCSLPYLNLADKDLNHLLCLRWIKPAVLQQKLCDIPVCVSPF